MSLPFIDPLRTKEFYLRMMPDSRLERGTVIAPPTAMHLTSETDPLRSVGLFGPVGLEVVLAKTIPSRVSLFFEDMDVLQARTEFCGLGLEYLIGPATRVLHHDQSGMPDQFEFGSPVLAYNLKLGFADHLREKYQLDTSDFLVDGTVATPRSILNLFRERAIHNLEKYNCELEKQPDISQILLEAKKVLDADIDFFTSVYGDFLLAERVAVAVNFELALRSDLPVSNLLFARDQAAVLYDTLYNSHMKNPIRQQEIDIMRIARSVIGLTNTREIVDSHEGAIMEMGDQLMLRGNLFMGCDIRTNLKGVSRITSGIYDMMVRNGRGAFAVAIPDQGNFEENLHMMHTDTFSSPVTDSLFAACDDIAQNTRVFRFGYEDRFRARYDPVGTLRDVIRPEAYIPVSTANQRELFLNFVLLDSGQPLVVKPNDGRTLDDVEFYRNLKRKLFEEYEREHKIIPVIRGVSLANATRGAGADHCLTMQFARGNFVLDRMGSAMRYAFTEEQFKRQITYLDKVRCT